MDYCFIDCCFVSCLLQMKGEAVFDCKAFLEALLSQDLGPGRHHKYIIIVAAFVTIIISFHAILIVYAPYHLSHPSGLH